jgi:hypothetical protein
MAAFYFPTGTNTSKDLLPHCCDFSVHGGVFHNEDLCLQFKESPEINTIPQ